MIKRLLFMSVVVAGMYCLTACSDKGGNKAEETEIAEADDFEIPEEFLLSSRFTPEQIDSLKRMSRVFYQHLRITEDSTYVLDLTEEEAIKLGMDKKFYEDAVKDIESSNESILKAKERGETITLMTPEELLEAVETAR